MKKKLFILFVCLFSSQGLWAKSEATLPLDEIRNFVDVYQIIRQEYVDEKAGDTLIDLAIKGMLQGLDPHSEYFKQAEMDDYQQSTQGKYLGFGIQLTIKKGRLVIISPIPDSPADKQGLLPNDIIAEIDGVIIDNLSMSAAGKLLSDKTTVTLTIARRGEAPFQVTLKKSSVVLPSVVAKKLMDDYGYIRIKQFQENTREQFDSSLKKLLKQSVKGLVLDLRNNPGGLLHAATGVADAFLSAGLIVSMKNQNTGDEEKIHASKETLAEKLPLVVLLNEGSASAAELLTGALQDHRRAIVVGNPSFGKGSVQNMVTLSNGDAIKLTTARYYTPNGVSIQAEGITPDILLSQLKVENQKINLLSYNESKIAGHLPSRQPEPQSPQPKHVPEQTSSEQSLSEKKAKQSEKTLKNVDGGDTLAKEDLQLYEALTVLKVLTLTH